MVVKNSVTLVHTKLPQTVVVFPTAAQLLWGRKVQKAVFILARNFARKSDTWTRTAKVFEMFFLEKVTGKLSAKRKEEGQNLK